ncbi:zinc ribbon domain-containing protein [Bifidobacterium sp. ESL0800]|uniref:zinc ribbon domain-containing protein n=1 Tax=Bifidobacterium sp. ESL0800 TaxID=2983236 RepID=UPI0023F91F56|nr:zinc ribbon domain-containing protein [Bifidobacterium sp. ESL0800]WEV75565.1 zinc ribbon domain-containing protein [Bifidobacterium sp. ESL0800]
MKFCENCGARVDDVAQFCAQCGTPVAQATQPMPPMPPMPASATSQGDFLAQSDQGTAAQGLTNRTSQIPASAWQIPQAEGPGSPVNTPAPGQPARASDGHKRRNIIIVVAAVVAVVAIALAAFFLTKPSSKGVTPESNAPATASGYPVDKWSLHMKADGLDTSVISVTVDKTGKASLRTPGGGDFIGVIDGKLGKPRVAGNSVTYRITKLNVPQDKQVVGNSGTSFSNDDKKEIQASTISLTMPRQGVVGNWRISVKVVGDKSSKADEYTMKVGADHTLTFGWDDGTGIHASGIRSGVWSKVKSKSKDTQRFTVTMESGGLTDDHHPDEAEFYFETPNY